MRKEKGNALKQRSDSANQKGNALFLILIAVILFAALAYAVTKSENGNAGQVSEEKLSIEYAKQQNMLSSVVTGLQRFALNGCDADNSDFTQPHSSTPSSNVSQNCIFFASHGGSVPVYPIEGGIDYYGTNAASAKITGIGTDHRDTVAVVNFGMQNFSDPTSPEFKASAALCNYINKKAGITGYTPTETDSFLDAESDTLNPLDESNAGAGTNLPAGFNGKSEGCFANSANVVFTHYVVAIER